MPPETTPRPDGSPKEARSRWVDERYPDYRRAVAASIEFSGLDVDFFTAGKGRWIGRELAALRSGPSRPCVLDLGCGIGAIHPHVIDRVDQLVGVDVSTEALQVARAANPAVQYVTFDGHRLPFPDGQFDVVFSICVVHHVAPDRWRFFLQEAGRVLRSGGTMLVFEHNPWNPLTRLAVSRCSFDHDAVLLSARTLRQTMLAAGFRDTRCRFIFFTPFTHAGAQWLDERLGFLPVGAQYYTAGVKA